MRCPKCSFISFDHLTSCAKCGRDISELAVELQGTSIKTEAPMFLSGALGAFSGEEEETFEEQTLDAEMEEGIDFDMEMQGEEEGQEEGEDVDFAFTEKGGEEADISLAEAEAEEAASIEAEAVEEAEAEEDASIEAEAIEESDLDLGMEGKEVSEEEKTEALAAEAEEIEEAEEKAAGGFEELDFSGDVDDGEEGGLEFDLEDFMEETDEDESDSSKAEDAAANLDDKKK